MRDYLKSYLQLGNRFCGIEHTLKGDQSILYTTILKRSKKEVYIETCFSSKTVEELASKLQKNQHVVLIINDDKVLTKALKGTVSNPLNLINSAFPNIDISGFYYEIILQGDISFVSICRKEHIDALIETYQKYNIQVVSFSLGNHIISSSVPYIDDTLVCTSNAKITTENNTIKTIDDAETDNEKHYNINGLNISNHHLLGFSGALSGIVDSRFSTTNYQDKKNILLNAYKQVRFFKLFLKNGLVAILAILLINFLFYNFYFNWVNTLNQASQINQHTKSSILKLNESVNKAKKTADDLFKSNASKSSFYIDAIVNSLPHSILLSEINYQPLKKTIRPDKPIENNTNAIVVSGSSNNKTEYSDWVVRLENMSWTKTVTVEAYNDSKTATSHFSIKININQ